MRGTLYWVFILEKFLDLYIGGECDRLFGEGEAGHRRNYYYLYVRTRQYTGVEKR